METARAKGNKKKSRVVRRSKREERVSARRKIFCFKRGITNSK